MTKVFISKDAWASCAETNNEKVIINKLVKDGWYDEEQYTKLIDNMLDMAKDMGDHETWYFISYYLDFEQYCEEYKDDDTLVQDYNLDNI